MHVYIFRGIELIFRKEWRVGQRTRAVWLTMFMFALTTLACVSMGMHAYSLAPQLLAALLWVILFFASMTGMDRMFVDEDLGGTLLALQIYGFPQAVLLGKMLYAFFSLLLMAAFILPVFLLFMDCQVTNVWLFTGTVFLGLWGIAAAGTLIAALTIRATVHSGLFSVLMLPITLPVFLPAIALTAAAFGKEEVALSYLGGIFLYNLILMTGASLLFDYLWYED